MKNAVIYFGSLRSDFARKQDWSVYSLAIAASEHLGLLQPYRRNGLKVFSYTHRKDPDQKAKLDSSQNDGVMLDWATAPETCISDLSDVLRSHGKNLIVNTGWGSHKKVDYGNADILIVESFIGSNSGDDNRWPVQYTRRDQREDIQRMVTLAELGYTTVALSYGPGDDICFADHCRKQAELAKACYFIYCQAPGWEKEGSGFRFYSFDTESTNE